MLNLKFYGLGGQGVVTAAKILSKAVSIYEDKYAITVPAYGHERRGAPVYTDIVVDDVPILQNCFVYEPDIVLVMDQTIRDRGIDIGEGKNDRTILVLNTESEALAREYQAQYGFRKTYYVDATHVAVRQIGKGIPNGAMLGALAKAGVVGLGSVEAALRETFGGKAGECNANAAAEAYENTNEV